MFEWERVGHPSITEEYVKKLKSYGLDVTNPRNYRPCLEDVVWTTGLVETAPLLTNPRNGIYCIYNFLTRKFEPAFKFFHRPLSKKNVPSLVPEQHSP